MKLLDFGLAQIQQPQLDESDSTAIMAAIHLTKPGAIIGTAAYMSPEQAQGQVTDQRSDVFCFGIVLYQMLTGALPFRSNSEVGILYQIVHTPAPSASGVRPDLPPALDRVLTIALQKDPNLRYPNMDKLLADLRGESSGARRPAPWRRWQWAAREGCGYYGASSTVSDQARQ